MRGDSGVAGEGRVVGVPKFHSWGKCTMPLTNIWPEYYLYYIIFYAGPLSCMLGCNILRAKLASYPGHVGGGKSGLVSTVCACAKNHDFMGYRIPSFTNRYSLPYSSEARPSRAYPAQGR